MINIDILMLNVRGHCASESKEPLRWRPFCTHSSVELSVTLLTPTRDPPSDLSLQTLT